MLRTYKAVLRGDRIEWIDPPPEYSRPTPVHITLLESPLPVPAAERGSAMARALEDLARAGTFTTIPDPVAWQRELRAERPLPGREP